jgi:predicted transcriptional regulator
MLDDAPRKLLRILGNMNYVPSIAELARKSGRTQGQVKMALRVLAVERFIEWDPDRHHELKIIQAWEYSYNLQQPAMKWWEHN